MDICNIMTLLLSLLSGILYRAGGKGGKWYFNTKFRDFGVAILVCLCLYFAKYTMPWWAWLTTFGVMFASLTTYWEKWGSDDVEWYEWLLTGLGYSLAILPVVYFNQLWTGFLYRTIILTLFTMYASIVYGGDEMEETTRGWLIIATLNLLKY